MTNRFFQDFSLPRFVAKATLSCIVFAAGVKTAADYSDIVEGWINGIKRTPWLFLKLYAAWVAMLFIVELVKLKVRFDLRALRAARGRGRKAAKRQRVRNP